MQLGKYFEEQHIKAKKVYFRNLKRTLINLSIYVSRGKEEESEISIEEYLAIQFLVGSATLPANKMKLVKLSLMRYKNGLSQMNGGKRIIILLVMTKAVAAAASEPSSLTSMKAFWTTAEVYNSASGSVIPESQKKTRNLFQ